ncbi:unnamed protein product [Ectocarpus sp. 4 AP-2014]
MLAFQGCSGIQESSSDQAIIYLYQQNRPERGGDFRAQPWLNVERGGGWWTEREGVSRCRKGRGVCVSFVLLNHGFAAGCGEALCGEPGARAGIAESPQDEAFRVKRCPSLAGGNEGGVQRDAGDGPGVLRRERRGAFVVEELLLQENRGLPQALAQVRAPGGVAGESQGLRGKRAPARHLPGVRPLPGRGDGVLLLAAEAF